MPGRVGTRALCAVLAVAALYLARGTRGTSFRSPETGWEEDWIGSPCNQAASECPVTVAYTPYFTPPQNADDTARFMLGNDNKDWSIAFDVIVQSDDCPSETAVYVHAGGFVDVHVFVCPGEFRILVVAEDVTCFDSQPMSFGVSSHIDVSQYVW